MGQIVGLRVAVLSVPGPPAVLRVISSRPANVQQVDRGRTAAHWLGKSLLSCIQVLFDNLYPTAEF
jgi:hypothetical protein